MYEVRPTPSISISSGYVLTTYDTVCVGLSLCHTEIKGYFYLLGLLTYLLKLLYLLIPSYVVIRYWYLYTSCPFSADRTNGRAIVTLLRLSSVVVCL